MTDAFDVLPEGGAFVLHGTGLYPPSVIGDGAKIGVGTVVRGSKIGSNTVVERTNACVNPCEIGDDSQVSNVQISDRLRAGQGAVAKDLEVQGGLALDDSATAEASVLKGDFALGPKATLSHALVDSRYSAIMLGAGATVEAVRFNLDEKVFAAFVVTFLTDGIYGLVGPKDPKLIFKDGVQISQGEEGLCADGSGDLAVTDGFKKGYYVGSLEELGKLCRKKKK